MPEDQEDKNLLAREVALPCGVLLKNSVAKSAMSDSLGDGQGNPTESQINLYKIWAEGCAGLSIIGEVQGNPRVAEKPGNLVLRGDAQLQKFERLAETGKTNGAQIWLQLGHAGAMTYPATGQPVGPSKLELRNLKCDALSLEEITKLPEEFAKTAHLAKTLGFGGMQVHAAHGFLLSQFLSPLFNTRDDRYGGPIANRMRLTLEVLGAIRDAVGPSFPIGIKLNATDQLQGGLTEEDALQVVAALNATSVDLIDISGGTYFQGAPSASDASGKGPYFLGFAQQARRLTSKPLMLTGGFKTYEQAMGALSSGVDVIGLARALVLDPALPNAWLAGNTQSPTFPRFNDPPEGGVTAWYTMRLTELAEGRDLSDPETLSEAIRAYEARDDARTAIWNTHFKG